MRALSVKKILRTPWVWFFFTTTFFQIFRGSLGDAIIFGLATTLIAIAATDALNVNLIDRKQVRLLVSAPMFVGLAIAMTAIPRHTGVLATIFLALLPLALTLVWHRDSGEKVKPPMDVKRARTLWAALCVGICLWELAANILGQLADSLYAFPTISVLIDPALDTVWGQGIFVSLWLLIGFGFLRLGTRR